MKKKKKLSNYGFTLIELLAVITIMGILMMVAIPAVSRTIENARRDTFADIAHEYINAVRNAMLADNIECFDGGLTSTDWHVASATPTGIYYFPICTSETNCAVANTYVLGDDGTASPVDNSKMEKATIVQSTSDLMESGGKSPFGNSEMQGYVKISKEVDLDTGKTTIRYTIKLLDSGGHGISSETTESQVKRSAISVAIEPDANANVLQSGKVNEAQKISGGDHDGEYQRDPDTKKIVYSPVTTGARVCKVS